MEEAIKNHSHEKLKDQFTPATRAVRRNLLISSSLAIALIMVGGDSIESVLGIKFSQGVPVYIPLGILFIVVWYELLTFIVYAYLDHKSWSLKPSEVTFELKQDNLNQLATNIKSASETTFRPLEDLEILFSPIDPSEPIHIIADPVHLLELHPDQIKIQDDINTKIRDLVSKKNAELTAACDSTIKIAQKEIEVKKNEAIELIGKEAEVFSLSVQNINQMIISYENEVKSYYQKIERFNLTQKFRIYFIDWGIPVLVGILSIYMNHRSFALFTEKLWSTVTLAA